MRCQGYQTAGVCAQASLSFCDLNAIKASGNPILFNILCSDLYPQLRMFRAQHRNTPGRGKRAIEEHRWILKAIEDCDADLAELLMRKHIASSSDSLRVSLE